MAKNQHAKKIKHLFSPQLSTLLLSFCQIIHFYLPVGYNYKSFKLTIYSNPVNSKFIIWQFLLANEISRFYCVWRCIWLQPDVIKLSKSDQMIRNLICTCMYQFLTESHHKTFVVFRSIPLFSHPCSKISTLLFGFGKYYFLREA